MDMTRRELIGTAGKLLILASGANCGGEPSVSVPATTPSGYDPTKHWWGMTIDVEKCIGCGNCVRACAAENNVPEGYFRTWIERYEVPENDEDRPIVESPDGGKHGFKPAPAGKAK